MIKATVLYCHPTNPESFEKYYSETHLEKVKKVSGIAKQEYTKFLANPDGSAAAYYRMAELYFASSEEMQKTMQSTEGEVMADDLANFATGGVTIFGIRPWPGFIPMENMGVALMANMNFILQRIAG